MEVFNHLLKEFPNQFISSCLTVWLIEIASNKSTSPILGDYILKIVKEDFHELESNIMLTSLSTSDTESQPESNWPEPLYSVITGLVEKIACVNYETINSLLSRMQTDCVYLAKSNVFSKCLQLLMNKMKSFSLINQADDITGGESLNDSIRRKIEIIISNNQTLMKKSLQISLKSLKFN